MVPKSCFPKNLDLSLEQRQWRTLVFWGFAPLKWRLQSENIGVGQEYISLLYDYFKLLYTSHKHINMQLIFLKK